MYLVLPCLWVWLFFNTKTLDYLCDSQAFVDFVSPQYFRHLRV
jgi:hypothetical protein